MAGNIGDMWDKYKKEKPKAPEFDFGREKLEEEALVSEIVPGELELKEKPSYENIPIPHTYRPGGVFFPVLPAAGSVSGPVPRHVPGQIPEKALEPAPGKKEPLPELPAVPSTYNARGIFGATPYPGLWPGAKNEKKEPSDPMKNKRTSPTEDRGDYKLKNLSRVKNIIDGKVNSMMDMMVEGKPGESSLTTLSRSILGLRDLLSYAQQGVQMPPEFEKFLKNNMKFVNRTLTGLQNKEFISRLEKENPDFHNFVLRVTESFLKLYQGLEEMSLYLEDNDCGHIISAVPVCQEALKRLGMIHKEARDQSRRGGRRPA
ncbi:MAG: hypothetical protein M1269_05690 [Chloroflexi bacterium]|nr:hypothetical protein [Chloroflexota bacterium]